MHTCVSHAVNTDDERICGHLKAVYGELCHHGTAHDVQIKNINEVRRSITNMTGEKHLHLGKKQFAPLSHKLRTETEILVFSECTAKYKFVTTAFKNISVVNFTTETK